MSQMNLIVSIEIKLKILESREWPMTNLRAKEAERAAQMFQKRREPDVADSED